MKRSISCHLLQWLKSFAKARKILRKDVGVSSNLMIYGNKVYASRPSAVLIQTASSVSQIFSIFSIIASFLFCITTAKIGNYFITFKFWSSKCKGKFIFALLSRDKIRQTGKFWSSKCREKFIFAMLSRDKIRQRANFGAADAGAD